MTSSRRILSGIAATTVLAAGAGPASAGQFNLNSSGGYVQVPPVQTHVGSPSVQPTVVRITTGGGFDWGDAGIGAGAGVAISALILGGGLIASQRRTGHIRHA